MRRNILAALSAMAALLPLSTQAQDAPTPGVAIPAVGTVGQRRVSAPAPPTLAEALAQAEAPQQDVYLAVGADRVRPPKLDAPDQPFPSLPPPGDPVPQVAQAYGRLVRAFETVTAIAPPTMTLLNTDPGTPNPFDGLPKGDAFKLLLESLSDAQWAALTSDRGLGPTDLTEDTQRALFATLFPARGVTLHPSHGWGGGGGPFEDHPLKLTESDMTQVRLRLGQRVMVGLPIIGKSAWMDSPSGSPDGQGQYQIYGGEGEQGKDTLYGVKVRETVPNVPKEGDLDFDRPIFKETISLEGAKTVGDLIARVGQAVRLEMYADRRYEKRSVTLLGPKAARARDVLQALALCVTGTYRRVGTAFVLTDDLMGTGTRRMILSRFAQAADLARHSVIADAGDKLLTAHGGVDTLPMRDADLGFSNAEKAQAGKGSMFQMPGQGMQIEVPLAQLTLAQQQVARRYSDQWNKERAANPSPPGSDSDQLTLDGKILLRAQPVVEMVTPIVPSAVNLESYFSAWDLFRPSQKLQNEWWKKKRQEQQAKMAPKPDPNAPKPPPPPALADVLRPIPRRAVIARPKTAADVDALVASMKTVGLNQLWLDVFSGGKSHLDAPKGAPKDTGPDILTEALAQTKGTDITVIPTLDLLDWDKDAPAEAQDRTMLGETSAEAKTHRQQYEGVMYMSMSAEDIARQPPVTDLSVSPASATVHQTLLALVGRLAATPGVTALALQGTVTPGYDRVPDSHYGAQGDALGYTPGLRLAFLRQQHMDPIDLEPESYEGQMTADTSLPEFDDYSAVSDASAKWNAFRVGADRDLMQRLLAAARAAGNPRFPLWVQTRRKAYNGNWYGLWEDPRGPLPELSEEKAYGGSSPDTDYAAFARTQCRTNVYAPESWIAQSAQSLVAGLQQMKPGWDGIVLDLTARSGNPLATLVKSLTPPAPTTETPKKTVEK